MEWVETTGRSIEEAKDAALDKLGIDETDAEFEILDEPKLGLFGRIRTEARVRARVRPNPPRPKENRRDRQRRGKSAGGSANATPAAAPAARVSDPDPVPSPVAAVVTDEQARPPKAPSRPRQDASGGRRTATAPAVAAALATEPPAPKPQGVTMDEDVPLLEQADIAQEFLVGLLASFEADGKVDVRELDEDTVELAVEGGPDLHLLIGPGGATLTAIQEITRRVVQRQTGARNGRLLVDVSGYRRKRKAALERFVETVAAEVRDRGVAKALEPMHAADRKVVHDTVNGLDGVHTSSEGEEPRRRVVISPS